MATTQHPKRRWTRARFDRAFGRALDKLGSHKISVIACRNGRQIKRGTVSVFFAPDGTIHRNDVRLDLAKRMTFRDAAKALGLEKFDD